MKTDTFKKLIKEAVREVFQEEIKDILYEALTQNKSVIKESYNPQNVNLSNKPAKGEITNKYAGMMDALKETTISMTSQDAIPFSTVGADSVNGSLPEGDLPIDMISALMSPK